ncbi:MAG: methyl-accepting chemotaxis protein [Oculatellaceae cyanobacterium Prado106]|nr:methyl-accepting chemotaxis protein [Oculatellaceae cyanobacterium Prado106]
MLKNISLQTRLTIAFLFMGGIVLVVALIGWTSNNRLNQHINEFSGNSFPSATGLWRVNYGQMQVQSAERLLLAPGLTIDERRQVLDQIELGWKMIDEGFKQYETTPKVTPEEIQLSQELHDGIDQWKQAHEKLLEVEREFHAFGIRNPWQQKIELLRQNKEQSPEMEKARAAIALIERIDSEVLTTEQKLFIAADQASTRLLELNEEGALETQRMAAQDLSQSGFWVLAGMAIGPITAMILGIVISRQITMQVVKVVGVAEQISEGDFTQKIRTDDLNEDEIGKLMRSFQTMSQKLNTLIRKVQQSGIQVTTSATKLAASGKQLEATATEQVASTQEVVATELVKTVEAVATTSHATTTAASSSQQDLARMQHTMQQLMVATSSIATKLETISEKANNINTVVVTITKVADQTNLLSLNAAIEAEKAGEYGLGFSVVAREIRRLADQTAVATLDIEQMVKEMQSAVSTGVMEMDKFAREVEQGVQDVDNIGGQLGQIIEQVQNLTPQFEVVNQGMEAQSEGAQQISEAMVQLSETSVQTADSLREINRAIEQLNEAAQNLRQEISRFKVDTGDLPENFNNPYSGNFGHPQWQPS